MAPDQKLPAAPKMAVLIPGAWSGDVCTTPWPPQIGFKNFQKWSKCVHWVGFIQSKLQKNEQKRKPGEKKQGKNCQFSTFSNAFWHLFTILVIFGENCFNGCFCECQIHKHPVIWKNDFYAKFTRSKPSPSIFFCGRGLLIFFRRYRTFRHRFHRLQFGFKCQNKI